MAIDFGQVFRGVATGAMSAYNEAVEKKDQMYAEIAVRAGDNYLNNILPETQKAEEMRKDNYDLIASNFGNNFAELMDINKITTQKDAFKIASDYYKNADKDKLKAAMFETNFDQRYNQRGKTFNEKYAPVKKFLGEGIGTMGPYTVDTLVGEKQEQPMKEVTTKDTMTDTVITEQTPVDFSSTAIKDYVSPMQSTIDLGTPNQVDQAISGFRGFDQGIIRDNAGNFAGMELFGEKANERNAFKAVMTRIAPNYVVGDTNKADLTSTAQVADKVLFDQTQGHIGDQILDGYQAATFKEKIRDRNFDINRYNATGFTKSFNEAHPTDDNKIEAILDYMYDNLQTRAERVHFAQSFAANIKDSDDNSYRNMLLIAIDPTLVIQDQ